MFNPVGSKATVCAFSGIPGRILTGHESGKVALFDAKTGEEVESNERAHMDVVSDLQMHPDRTYFITSSKDKTARVSVVFKFRREGGDIDRTDAARSHASVRYTRRRRYVC